MADATKLLEEAEENIAKALAVVQLTLIDNAIDPLVEAKRLVEEAREEIKRGAAVRS